MTNMTKWYMISDDSRHGRSDGIGPCAIRRDALCVLREHYDALKCNNDCVVESKINFATNEMEEFTVTFATGQRRRYAIEPRKEWNHDLYRTSSWTM